MSNNDRVMLKAMLTNPSKEWKIQELLDSTGWDDQVYVAGSGQSLSESGLVVVTENHRRMVSLDFEGKRLSTWDSWRIGFGNGIWLQMRKRELWKAYFKLDFREMKLDQELDF